MHSYQYDPNGNRTFAPNLVAAPEYDVQDRLKSYPTAAGTCTYEYRTNGALRQKTCPDGITTYDYDSWGNLRHVDLPGGTAIDYVIDGQNRRVGKKMNGVMVEGFLYEDDLKRVAWLSSVLARSRRSSPYVGGNEPAYMRTGGGTYSLIKDQLGSIRAVVDALSGAVGERIDYDDFGNVLTDLGALGMTPFSFASGLLGRDTWLVRFGARDYDARARAGGLQRILCDSGAA